MRTNRLASAAGLSARYLALARARLCDRSRHLRQCQRLTQSELRREGAMERTTVWTVVVITIIAAILAVAAITEIHKISKELRKLRRVLDKPRGGSSSDQPR